MQSLKVWATEIEIYGAAHMLEATIYTLHMDQAAIGSSLSANSSLQDPV